MIAHYVRIDGDVRDIRAVNTCLLVAQRQLDVRALNDTNKRLLEAQSDLEDALEQFQRVIRPMEDLQAHV